MIRRVLGVAAAALGLSQGVVQAGIVVDGRMAGLTVRIELGDSPERVALAVDGKQRLVDLATSEVYLLDGPGPRRVKAAMLDDLEPYHPYVLQHWYGGPMVAGHGSTYHILKLDEAICGEVAASEWMKPFLEPAIRAVELVQRLDRRIGPKRREGCGAVPFEAYARNGFPLMAGWKDEPFWVTERIRFDHQPGPRTFELPASFTDCLPRQRC